MISNVTRTIEIHIPRTGGRSRRSLFTDVDPRIFHGVHRPVSEFLAYFGDDAKFAQYFSYAFIRNPWERIASLYHWVRRQRAYNAHQLEFPAWLAQMYQHGKGHLSRSQWDTIAVGGEVKVDFVGRFERMEKDWRVVADRAGLPRTLPRINNNDPYPHYSTVYDEAARQMVEEREAGIIRYAGYRFEREDGG